MPWVRVDDHFDEHPKLAKVGPLAWGVWLAGIAYCNRNLTDGFIPRAKAQTLASFEVVDESGVVWRLGRTSGFTGEDINPDWVIGLLLDAELWEEVDNGQGRVDGYRVHDFDKYQPSKADVLAEREANRKRQGRFRNKGDSNAVTNADVTPLITRPPVPVPVPHTEYVQPSVQIAPAPSPNGHRPARSRPAVEGFEEFWKAYPRKSGKGAARKAWNALRPSPLRLVQMLKAIAAQAESWQWRKDGGQYIPLPATWLNQDRWEDEPGPKAPPAVGREDEEWQREKARLLRGIK